MSILIKGMEMPKSCEDCNFYYTDYEEGTATCLAASCYVTPQQYNKGNRDSDCPLVEIPTPHGRLIDEEAIYNNVKSRCNNCHIRACAICGVTCILNDIRTAPTIIEAEVSE